MVKNEMVLKQTKFIVSIVKEKLWLEKMALEGWQLKEITMGMRYTFEKSEPKKMIYEVDRFNLPKNPTLKEIRHKDEFLAMATEMGWKVIVHDEDLNYYFCKEYKDGEINELYNDFDSRLYRAEKYHKRYKEFGEVMTKLSFLVSIFGLLLAFINLMETNSKWGFLTFVFGYLVFCLGFGVIYNNLAKLYYNELLMTTEEWKALHITFSHNKKTSRKLIFTNRKINKFLAEQSKKGWHLVNMSALKYVFTSGESAEYIYTLDSKSLTNKRIRAKGANKLKDSKDWLGINNDWQVLSLKDAESKNWTFVCAIDNRAILYRSQANTNPEVLNEERYEKRFRFISLTGQMGIWILIGSVLGFFVGIAAVKLGL